MNHEIRNEIEMESKAILQVYGSENQFVNLYLPHEVWRKLISKLGSNKLTVVLRMMYEYSGELKLEEKQNYKKFRIERLE